MKKIIFILLCIFMFIPVVSAAPKRNTRSLETFKIAEADKNYKLGEKLFFDFKILTDASTVDNVSVFFRSANYDSYFLADLHDITGNSYLVLPKNIESNYYTVSYLTINYKDGRRSMYSRTGIEPLSTKYDFGNDYISIGNIENDLVHKIKSASFSSETVTSGSSETLTIVLDSVVDIDQNNSFAIITNGENVSKISLNGNKTNTITGNIILTGKESTYYLDSITINDKKNNSKSIYYKNEEIEGNKSFCDDGKVECLDSKVSFKLEKNTDEEDTPVLSSVKFNKNKTSSNAKVFVDATDSGSGINSATVTLYKIDDDGVIDLDSKITTNLYYDNIIEEYVGMINFNNKPLGKYYIFKIELLDNLNASKEVCLNDCDTETIVNLNTNKYDTIELVESTSEVLSIKDTGLVEKIKESKDGETITIDISNNTIVAKEVFAAIQNTNKTLVFKDNGIEWIFRGNDIEKHKDVDLSFRSSIYYKKELGNDYIALELSDKGTLPGKAKVRINSLYTYQYEKGNDKVNVYYVNGDKYSETETNIEIKEDGYYEFEISQTGTYILSDKRISESLIINDDVEEDNNNNDNKKVRPKKKDNTIPIIILIAIPSVFLLVVITMHIINVIKMKKNSLENYVVDDPIVATPLEEEEEKEDKEINMKYKSKENK